MTNRVLLGLLLSAIGGCASQPAQTSIPSPDGKYVLHTSINQSKADPRTYRCVQFQIANTQGKTLYSCQTHASDRMRWSIEWSSQNGVLLKSSDIGNRSWTKQSNSELWTEAQQSRDLNYVQASQSQPADSDTPIGSQQGASGEFEFYRPALGRDKPGGEILFQLLNRNWNLQADLLELRQSAGQPVQDLMGHVTKMGYMVAGKIVPPTNSKSLLVEIELRVRLHGIVLNTIEARRIRISASLEGATWKFENPISVSTK